MNYLLQGWLADRIADTIFVESFSMTPGRAPHTAHEQLGEYIAMRTEYAHQHHWPIDPSGIDIDRYDHNPNTRYFLSYERGGSGHNKLMGGMRLTKTQAFEDTLSLSMWTHAIDKPHFVVQLIDKKHEVQHLKKAAHQGELWDLTRLVTAMSLQEERTSQMKRATYVALLLLLGAAFRYTGSDAHWLFTTNGEVKRFLDRLGIPYSLLGQGKISYSDVGESFLCWSAAGDAFEQLKQGQPVIADLVQRGYAVANTPK